MTNEQREAIDLAKEFTKIDFNNPRGWTGYYDTDLKELSQAIDTVLSLTKEQDKYIKDANDITTEMSNDIKKLTSEIEKKDKQIDLMAKFIENNISEKKIINEICIKSKCNNEECHEDDLKDCIKQYFERKVEDENKK